MADNIAITAGSGTTIATDDASSAHYQRVKLTDGTADSTTVIAAGEGVKANALRVALPTDAADVKVTLDGETVALGSTDAANLDYIQQHLSALHSAVASIGEDSLMVKGSQASGDGVPAFGGLLTMASDGTYVRNIASDSSGHLQVDALTMPGTGVEDAAETAGGTLLMAGSVRRDTPASSAGSTGDNATINTNKVGALWTALAPATPYKNIDVDESEDEISSAACILNGFYAYCNTAAGTKRYLKLYNATAANVTVGTTAPDMTFELDGVQGLVWSTPLLFSTALTVAATTGVADNDSGAPGANDVVFNCGYSAL